MTLTNTNVATSHHPQGTLQQCTIIPSTEVAVFFEETNKLVALYKDDSLFTNLVKGLRRHCNALIPMASKQYKTQGNNCTLPVIVLPIHESGNLIFEIGHDGGHVIGHGAHYLLHVLHVNDLIHITEAVLHAIPVISIVACALIKAIEIWHEHHVLHEIEKQLAKFHDFSHAEYDALYQFVIAKTLNTLKHQRNLAPHPKGWHFLLLIQSLISLSNISHHFDTLTAFAEAWSDDIIKQFITYGVYMLDKNEIIYNKTDMEVALKVQTIFSASDYEHEYLNKTFSRFKALAGQLEKGICEILNPYSVRVASSAASWISNMHYRPNELDTLKSYYARFNEALELLNQKQADLNQSVDGVIELNLIATMLKGHLDKMANELIDCWYVAGLKNLVIKMNALKILSICNPLNDKGNNKIGVSDPALVTEILRIKANELTAKLAASEEAHTVTKKALKVTEKALKVTEKTLKETEKALKVTKKALKISKSKHAATQLENSSLKKKIRRYDSKLQAHEENIKNLYTLHEKGLGFFNSSTSETSSPSSSASCNL